MKLFNSTGEYVRADEIRVEDVARVAGKFQRVTYVGAVGASVEIRYDDGSGQVSPRESRILRKTPLGLQEMREEVSRA